MIVDVIRELFMKKQEKIANAHLYFSINTAN